MIVLEKGGRPGGNAMLAVVLFAINSPTLQRLGRAVSIDEVIRFHLDQAKWILDPKLLRTFYEKTAEVGGWLEDKGIQFATGTFPLIGKDFRYIKWPHARVVTSGMTHPLDRDLSAVRLLK